LKIRPDFVLALNNLAWVLVQQGKPGAAGWAQRAVNLSPDQPALLDTLAQSLAAEGKVPQALEAQKQAAQLTPGDPGMRFRLAQLAIKAGDKALARSELEQVLAINARNPFREEAAKLVKGL
jgi:predicted Zn-dependent protease